MKEEFEGGEVYRLRGEERASILRVLKDITKDKEVVALCAYGSHIAGYAREDSDYDLLVVFEDYRPKVKYTYLKKELDLSTLIVNKNSLIGDAEKASLGEFVVGRLLNVYEPLIGSGFITDVEKEYKKRVTMELLDEIIAEYGDFSTEFTIPVSYLLFEKLRKRATLYPPALYSYVKTYSGGMGEENLWASIRGFLTPLAEMEDQGWISLQNDAFGIREEYLKVRKPRKLWAAMGTTKKGLTSYAVHGYAGRVSLSVVKKELLSKISRTRKIGEVPNELTSPRNLWRLDEGLLIVEGDDWLLDVMKYLNFSEGTEVRQKQMGELSNVVKMYTLEDGEKQMLLAVKRFRDPMSIKWALLNVWILMAKWFEISPLKRLGREYRAIRKLRAIGLNTPQIIATILGERMMITRFVEGTNLGRIVNAALEGQDVELNPVTLYGEALALAHTHGYTLGDTKPSNIIYSDGRVFLTDLEQASEGGDKAWDVAEFVYYSSKLTLNVEGARRVVRAFLDGYLKMGDADAIKKALNLKYLAPFQALLAPTVTKAIRDEMSEVIGN